MGLSIASRSAILDNRSTSVSFLLFLMSRAKRLFIRALPATFIAGVLFGSSVTSLGAAFRASAIFRDVPSTHYADEAIGEMYQLGIIKGLDSSHFGPDEPLTRGQAALLFQRLRNEIKGITPTSSSSSSRSSSSSTSSSSVSSSTSSTSSSSSSYNPGGSIRFNANSYNVDKNVATGEVSIQIVRIGGNTGAGTVDYAFSGATAVAGKNFTPVSGTLTFATKETSKKVTVKIFNDTSTTGTKTVNLTLSRPTGALTIGDPKTVVLNINDPSVASSSSSSLSSSVSAATTVALSASAYGIAENAGTITITVNRTGVTTSTVGVNYATSNGSATVGADYTAASGTFTFNSGETVKTFTVPIANNTSTEGNRSFNIILSSPTGGTAIGTTSATVTINDDESVPVTGSGSMKFSASSYSATETSGQAIITVNHAGGLGPVSVSYSTNGGTALPGVDYVATSGTLHFAAGETSKTFSIPIYGDSVSDAGEVIYISISNPTGGTPLTDPTSASVTINEN